MSNAAAALFVAALLALCLLGGSALARTTSSAPHAVHVAAAAKPNRQLPAAVKCSITQLHLGGGMASAVGGCKYAKSHKVVPVRWTRSIEVDDVYGSPCHITLPTGKTRSFSYRPASAGYVSVQFTVWPLKGRGQPASRTADRRNDNSRDICVNMPPLQAAANADSSGQCSMVGQPGYGEAGIGIGLVACPANWGCHWQVVTKLPQHESGFTIWGATEAVCHETLPGVAKGFHVSTHIGIWSDQVNKPTGCDGGFSDLDHLPILPSWSGGVQWSLDVVTLKPDPANPTGEIGNLSGYVFAGGPNGGNFSPWVQLSGNVDPCSPAAGLGWESVTFDP